MQYASLDSNSRFIPPIPKNFFFFIIITNKIDSIVSAIIYFDVIYGCCIKFSFPFIMNFNGTSFWNTLEQNVGGISTLTSTAILAFSGGILFLVLRLTTNPVVGYLMAPALFGFILAVRGNVADAQRQTELKEQCFGQPRTVCTEAHM